MQSKVQANRNKCTSQASRLYIPNIQKAHPLSNCGAICTLLQPELTMIDLKTQSLRKLMISIMLQQHKQPRLEITTQCHTFKSTRSTITSPQVDRPSPSTTSMHTLYYHLLVHNTSSITRSYSRAPPDPPPQRSDRDSHRRVGEPGSQGALLPRTLARR